MLPPDGWRLEAELYSPASNKTSSPPQARRVLRLSDSPLTLPVTRQTRHVRLQESCLPRLRSLIHFAKEVDGHSYFSILCTGVTAFNRDGLNIESVLSREVCCGLSR